MNYSKYYPIDVLNGEGTRSTLFVSGCIHHCRGCYNQSTWSLDSGLLFTEQLADQIIQDLNDTRIKKQGLTLSGGDPLHPANIAEILKLIHRVKKECHHKDIWMWSGYVLDELTDTQQQVIKLVDVFIDGKFDSKFADANEAWRGSTNQIIHRFKY